MRKRLGAREPESPPPLLQALFSAIRATNLTNHQAVDSPGIILDWRGLSWLLLLGAALRLAVIFLPPDAMFEHGRNVVIEELQRGNAAWDLRRGPVLPLYDYQLNHFWGGSALYSWLAIPVLAVLGDTLPVLRLLTIVFSLLSIACIHQLMVRSEGLLGARIGGGLVAFAPPGYVLTSCYAYGTHMESNAMSMALVCMWIWWRRLPAGEGWASLIFGFFVGVCAWFGYGLWLTIGVLAVLDGASLLACPRRIAWIKVAGGFMVGFAPWVTFMLAHPRTAMHVYDQPAWAYFDTAVWLDGLGSKLLSMLTEDAPAAMWFQPAFGDAGRFVGLFVLVAVGALACAAIPATLRGLRDLVGSIKANGRLASGRIHGAPAAVTLRQVAFGSLLVWVTAYACSGFHVVRTNWVVDSRYFMPMWILLAVLAGCGAHDLAQAGRWPIARKGTMVACMLVSVAGLTLQLKPGRFEDNLATPSVSLPWFGHLIIRRYSDDPIALRRIVARIALRSQEDREGLAKCISRALAHMARLRGPQGEVGAHGRQCHESLAQLALHAPQEIKHIFRSELERLGPPPGTDAVKGTW